MIDDQKLGLRQYNVPYGDQPATNFVQPTAIGDVITSTDGISWEAGSVATGPIIGPGTGFVVQDSGSFAMRELTPLDGSITITDGDGAAGNPTIGVGVISQSQVSNLPIDLGNITTALAGKQDSSATLTALGAYNTNGHLVQTAPGSFAGRTQTGTANRIVITNGDGVSGNPTYDVGPDVLTAAGATLGNGLVFGGGTWGAYPNAVIPTIYTPELRVWRSIVLGTTTATTYTALGIASALTLPGTETSVSDTTGNYISCASAAVLNSDAGVSSAITVVQTRLKPRAFFHIKTGPSLATLRIFVGLTSVVATQIAADLPATHFAGFRYSPASDLTAFWRTLTNDAGVGGTVTDTTVPIAVDTAYTLCIDSTDPASIKFYINGVLVATHIADLPATSQNLGLIAYVRTLEAVAKTIRTGAIQVECVQ